MGRPRDGGWERCAKEAGKCDRPSVVVDFRGKGKSTAGGVKQGDNGQVRVGDSTYPVISTLARYSDVPGHSPDV